MGLLTTRADRLAEQRREIRTLIHHAVTTGVHPLFLVEEEYRRVLLDAEAEFIEGFVERITHPQTGWAAQWSQYHQGQRSEHEEQEF